MATRSLWVCPSCQRRLAKSASSSSFKCCPNCGTVMGVFFERIIERDARGVIAEMTKGW